MTLQECINELINRNTQLTQAIGEMHKIRCASVSQLENDNNLNSFSKFDELYKRCLTELHKALEITQDQVIVSCIISTELANLIIKTLNALLLNLQRQLSLQEFFAAAVSIKNCFNNLKEEFEQSGVPKEQQEVSRCYIQYLENLSLFFEKTFEASCFYEKTAEQQKEMLSPAISPPRKEMNRSNSLRRFFGSMSDLFTNPAKLSNPPGSPQIISKTF